MTTAREAEQNAIVMTAAIIRSHLKERGYWRGLSVQDKARECFKQALDSGVGWMLDGSDDQAFRTGVGALLLMEPELQLQINREMKALHTLSAAMGGVPVDWDAFLVEVEEEPISLMAIYKEIAGLVS